jgi:ribosomal-protein-alanine N-acetyltransferase
MSDGRVVLRDLRSDDALAYARAFAEDTELGWLIGSEEDPAEADALQSMDEEREHRDEGRGATFAITERGSDEFLGDVVLFAIDWRHLRGEAGIWLRPAARGRGLALGALRLVCAWAFDDLALERLEMKTVPDNEPMLRLAQAAGFTREGVLRSYDRVRGRRSDLVLVSLLPGELSAG